MKSILFAMFAAALLVGCGGQDSSQQLSPVQKATQDYTAITPSMTQEEVYHRLGQPEKKTPEGAEEWRTSSERQVAVLALTFGPDGKITSHDFYVDDPGAFRPQ